MNKYKFYITDSISTTEVFPLGFEKDRLVFQRQKNVAYTQLKLSGSLTFSNRPKESVYDFNFFLAKDANDLRCEELTFTIKRSCDGAVYSNYWIGVFEIVEGDFDLDRCTYSVQPRLKDYIFADRQINICDIPGTFTVDADAGIAGETRTYDGCKNLSSILTYFATDVSDGLVGIVSDFFQINPTIVSNNNYVTNTTNKYKQLVLTPISNIQEPVPTNPATIEMASFNQIMDDLLVLFDVHWYVDTNLNIRIEHYTFFDGVAGLDLTVAPYNEYVAYQNKYSYDAEDSPKSETWKTYNSDSYGKITYGICGDLNKDETIYTTQLIATDYYTLRWVTGGEKTKGLFLFATETIVGVRYMFGRKQNEELVIPRLILRFHRWGRPALYNCQFEYSGGDFDFTMNDHGGAFMYSEKPTRKQVKLSFPLCCGVSVNIADTMKTSLGDGYIQSYEHKVKDNMLSVELKYKLNSDVSEGTPDQISGLQLWLKGDVGVTTIFGRVSSWADQSGNGNHAVQAVNANRPTTLSNQVVFTGGEYLITPAFQMMPSKRGTIFMLHRKDPLSLGANSFLSTQGGAGTTWDITYDYNGAGAGSDEHRYYDLTNSLYYPAYGYVSNTNLVYRWGQELNLFELIRYSDTEQTVWLNGKEVDAANGNPMIIPNTQPASNPLYIGDNPNIVGIGCSGEIAEIIVYDHELTDIERQKIELYLSKKWHINLFHIS